MKKLIFLLFVFLISSVSVFASDIKFVQVDGVLLNAGDENSVSSFHNLVADINKLKDVDFVVFTGNNILKPTEENLKKFLKEARKLKAPFYVVLGQKDVNKQKHFGKKEYTKLLRKRNFAMRGIKEPNYLFTKKDLVFIAVDGSKEVIPIPNGYYRPETLNWLDTQLNKYQDKNVFILQHYPIVPPVKKEGYYTYNAEEYVQLLGKHNNVKAVFSGHFNSNKEQEVNGVMHISTSNAPSYRIVDITDTETDKPVIWCVIKE